MQMQRLREWSFPVLLIVAWMIVTGYTLGMLGKAWRAHHPVTGPLVIEQQPGFPSI